LEQVRRVSGQQLVLGTAGLINDGVIDVLESFSIKIVNGQPVMMGLLDSMD